MTGIHTETESGFSCYFFLLHFDLVISHPTFLHSSSGVEKLFYSSTLDIVRLTYIVGDRKKY